MFTFSLQKVTHLFYNKHTGITHIASAFNIPTIVHKSNESVYPKSSISIENSLYDDNLYKMAEDILEYIYIMSA